MTTCFISCTGCSKSDVAPIQNATTLTLTEQEKSDLLFLREEEKLARDIYLHAWEKYKHMTFDHISNSEQTHMDRALDLIHKYGLTDPAISERGVFNNPNLQVLYNQLLSKTNQSELDALIVGATIEDLDINDIDKLLTHTSNPDLITVYSDLNCGSRNHMRAFSSQIETSGGSYTPQYVSPEKYKSIIENEKENCGGGH
ncbi:MAG: DUF2202 domain-containing protein [Bacteroidetes bacterium]|nr:DUF2202 domain-containing protein [Bacteroidota bacterium]